MKKLDWTIEKRKISELKKWDKNPRTITGKEFNKLVESIKENGDHDILKIDIDNTVISGNQRLEAFKEAGKSEVFVRVPNRKLTQKEMDRIGLESNTHSGKWDMDILANEFEEEILNILDIKTLEKPDVIDGDIKFSEVWNENNQYIILQTTDDMDWDFIAEYLGIESVLDGSSRDGYVRKGVERVIDLKRLIQKINENIN